VPVAAAPAPTEKGPWVRYVAIAIIAGIVAYLMFRSKG
jgi:hypothetical protein